MKRTVYQTKQQTPQCSSQVRSVSALKRQDDLHVPPLEWYSSCRLTILDVFQHASHSEMCRGQKNSMRIRLTWTKPLDFGYMSKFTCFTKLWIPIVRDVKQENGTLNCNENVFQRRKNHQQWSCPTTQLCLPQWKILVFLKTCEDLPSKRQ